MNCSHSTERNIINVEHIYIHSTRKHLIDVNEIYISNVYRVLSVPALMIS